MGGERVNLLLLNKHCRHSVNLQVRAVVMFFRPPMIAVCSLQTCTKFIAALTDIEDNSVFNE